MADQVVQSDDPNVTYTNGVPRRMGLQARPGLAGALKDAAQGYMNNSQPSQTGSGGRQREAAIDTAVDSSVTGRQRQAQSTDRDNSYSY